VKQLHGLAVLLFGICSALSCQRRTTTAKVSRHDGGSAPSLVANESSAYVRLLPIADAGAPMNSVANNDVIVDSPSWPDGTKSLRLTWVIYPAVMRKERPDIEFPARQIEIVVSSGKVARHFATEERYSVTYATSMQRLCQGPPFTKARVAELFMNGGGNTVLAVDRKGSELQLTEELSSDGQCEPGPCPIKSKLLARIPTPPNVPITEHFHIVEGRGVEHDEACESTPVDG